MSDIIKQFKAAREVGTPVIAIKTPDQGATITALAKTCSRIVIEGKATDVPMIQWDIINGWEHCNAPGKKLLNNDFDDDAIKKKSVGPVSQIVLAQELPQPSVLFMINAHRYVVDNVQFIQGLWNLRNPYSTSLRTAVLLGPDFDFPPELRNDVLIIDEPLPDDKALEVIVKKLLKSAGFPGQPTEPAVTALRGLAEFPAEQSTALSIIPGTGLDIPTLWERKRQMINDTPGLSVWRGMDKFDQLGGLYQAKTYFSRVIAGKDPFRVVVFIDEGEKVFAGATGEMRDSSGISSGFLATMLSYQQDTEADGVLFMGPTGAAKSAFAKCLANEAGVLCINLDLNGMKSSLVGESEGKLRQGLKVITAVGGGRALFVMTCNRMVDLPPELRRRYSDIFFFDLPDREERATIWSIYQNRYNLTDVEPDLSLPWTGDEIRRCCLKAYRLGMTLEEASEYIVPVAKSAALEMKELREQANGRFLSAAYPGVYRYDSNKREGSRAFANNSNALN